MPFTNLTNLGVTATFNDLFNSHNTLISRGNSLGIGSIFAGNGITATSLDSSGGITLSARLNQGSGITLTQGPAGITIGLNTAFITGGTGINVSPSSSGITVSVKLNAGTGITLTQGPAGITIDSSGGGSSTEATFANSQTSTLIALPSGGTAFTGKTALQILNIILFPYQVPTLTYTTVGLTLSPFIFVVGQTSSAGNYTSTWSSTNSSNFNSNSGTIKKIQSGSPTTILATGINIASGSVVVNHTTAYRPTTPETIQFSIEGTATNNTTITAFNSIHWRHQIWWGRSTVDLLTASSITLSHITTDLGSNRFTSSNNALGNHSYTFSSTDIPGNSAYLVVPINPGNITNYTTFTINSGTITPASRDISIANTHGILTTWRIYLISESVDGFILNAS